MAHPARHKRKKVLCAIALILLGLWYGITALISIARTAAFVHESVVVEGTVRNLRQKPFESWADTLGKGNLSWPGDPSYQPIVSFRLPGEALLRTASLDADNEDYANEQVVSVIVPEERPQEARLYRWKFLWGGDFLRLLAAALLLLPGWLMLRRQRAPRPATKANAPGKAARSPRRESRGRRPAPADAQQEEPFTLSNDVPAPRRRKTGTPRRRKTPPHEDSAAAPRKTRARRRGDGDTASTPRKSRSPKATR